MSGKWFFGVCLEKHVNKIGIIINFAEKDDIEKWKQSFITRDPGTPIPDDDTIRIKMAKSYAKRNNYVNENLSSLDGWKLVVGKWFFELCKEEHVDKIWTIINFAEKYDIEKWKQSFITRNPGTSTPDDDTIRINMAKMKANIHNYVN